MNRRDQRGVAAPSLLVMLSIIAVAMAGIAFVATKDPRPDEKVVPIAARETPEPTATAAPSKKPTPKPTPTKAALDKSQVMVVVFNQSGVAGLAKTVGAQATDAGWQVVGVDNWRGSVPENTVYVPDRLKDAGKQLALDLGIKRTMTPAENMTGDRLTVVLTGPLG